jgi:hypothetical protein
MRAPKSEKKLMMVIKQGGTAETALDATNGTIDNKTKTRVYSRCTGYRTK